MIQLIQISVSIVCMEFALPSHFLPKKGIHTHTYSLTLSHSLAHQEREKGERKKENETWKEIPTTSRKGEISLNLGQISVTDCRLLSENLFNILI